jgi:anti-sigma28 factor (negative regulator of flagellin synthesis)
MPATKKSPAKKSAAKKSRKYSSAAGKSVEREMKAMKAGTLRSSSGDKVTNPKQAIAIGLSEARREGMKVPPSPSKS